MRDAHIGVLWEGTSNINALDIITRAVGKGGAHRALAALVEAPARCRAQICRMRSEAASRRHSIAPSPSPNASPARRTNLRCGSPQARSIHATSAVLLAWEGAQPEVDPRRALYARFVLDHRLSHRDPLEPENNTFEREAIDLVLGEGKSSSAQVMRLLERRSYSIKKPGATMAI